MAIDAILGASILKQVFENGKVEFESESREQVHVPLSEEINSKAKNFNNRLPKVVMENEMGRKMFYRGWKFDMFNDIKQFNKATAAVCVIFAMFFFSLASLLTQVLEHKTEDHQSFTIIVFTYSVISMFTYFNVAYVRDFNALQVNFTPIMLTVCGAMSLLKSCDFFIIGMVISLMADSYFALRYSENHDQIAFSVVERFAMESWC